MEPTVPIEVFKMLATAGLDEPGPTPAAEPSAELPPRFFWTRLILNYMFRFSALGCGVLLIWMLYGAPRGQQPEIDRKDDATSLDLARAELENARKGIEERSRQNDKLAEQAELARAELVEARKALEERDTQINEISQKSLAQAKDIATQAREISALRARVNSVPAETARAIMALGPTISAFAFVPTPGPPLSLSPFPAQTDKPNENSDVSEGDEKPHCTLLFNTLPWCPFTSSSSAQQ